MLASLIDNRNAGAALEADLRKLCREADADQALLSERRLAHEYGISHGTVRRVLDNLLADGLIYKVHGKGTFVASPNKQDKAVVVYVDTWKDPAHPFFAGRLRGILEACETYDWRLEILRCERQIDDKDALLAELDRPHVRGLIAPWISAELLQRIRGLGGRLNIVATASTDPPPGVSAVGVDFFGLGAAAIRYLAQQGAKRPTCVLKHALTRCGITRGSRELGIEPSFVDFPEPSSESVDLIVSKIEQLSGDGLVFDDDRLASHILPGIDISSIPVISHDNQGSDRLPGAIARLLIDGEAAGHLVVQRLHELMTNPSSADTVHWLRPILITPNGARRHDSSTSPPPTRLHAH